MKIFIGIKFILNLFISLWLFLFLPKHLFRKFEGHIITSRKIFWSRQFLYIHIFSPFISSQWWWAERERWARGKREADSEWKISFDYKSGHKTDRKINPNGVQHVLCLWMERMGVSWRKFWKFLQMLHQKKKWRKSEGKKSVNHVLVMFFSSISFYFFLLLLSPYQ